ncbi:MAG TPA: hypothetical protein VGR85_06575 [Candidatus Limnocylindria bacterium]|nr:hypothetical protein [Candidatus Limnocylindria bacterium]
MIAIAVLAGYLAGLIVALLTVGAENSRIAFGNYALYGNGALVVPAILAPFALYPGWAWLLAHDGDRRLEAALYTLGLHFGVGMVSVIEAVLFPQSVDVTLLSALPGFVLTGVLFVIPAALFGAATLWLVRSGHVPITPLTASFGIVIATLTALLFGAGLGILSGGAVALALERPARRVTIGIALLVLLIIVGNAPLVAALVMPTR